MPTPVVDAGGKVGLLREGYPNEDVLKLEHVYHNGDKVKMGSLKDLEPFSHTLNAPKFVYIANKSIFRAIDQEVMAMDARAREDDFGHPKAGIVKVGNRFYKFIVTQYGLRIRTVYEGTEKNDTLFANWRRSYENFANTEEGYASDEEVERGLFDSGDDYDILATGETIKHLDGVDRVVFERVRRKSSERRISDGDGRNPKAYPDTRNKDSGKRGVGKNAGLLREAAPLDEHLQARREAMPKMGLEAARANVQAALHREEGESNKAWTKRKLKATSDFIVEKTVDARQPVIDAMREISGTDKYSERTDIPLAMQLSYGRVFEQHLDIDHNYVNPTLKILADKGLDIETLDTYLVAMHAPERNKMIKERTTFGRNR